MRAALFNDTTSDLHHGCDAVMAAIAEGCARIGANIVFRHPVGVDWRSSSPALEALASVDLVLVNGEGSIHHDNARADALTALGPHCRERGVPAVLINASLYQVPRTLPRLAAFSRVFTRDAYSQELCLAAGVSAEATGDLSFAHDLNQAAPIPTTPSVCFTDSVERRDTARLSRNAGTLGASVLPMQGPHRFGDYRAYAGLLASHGFVVTGRYHGACLALNAGVPFVATPSNTNKIEALLSDVFGDCARIRDPRALGRSPLDPETWPGLNPRQWVSRTLRTRRLMRQIEPLLRFNDAETRQIAAYKAKARSAIEDMWRAIAAPTL